ncbi:MAG: glycosyltransferase [Patescibacteria group bacterium]|nr:glycosyltransferase [Patescibacteria group bacterium]
MIVKNEADRIVRALDSVTPFLSCYAITDTGSDDNTREVIDNYFKHHKIPGHTFSAPFRDWSQARNAALVNARSMLARHQWEYLLLMDADMQLVMNDVLAFETILKCRGLAYEVEQRGNGMHYNNVRFVSAASKKFYRGVTHEYFDEASAGVIPSAVAFFTDHADGANRPNKFQRDIQLLLDDLKRDPDNARSYFYLAQSYRDAHDYTNAKYWYAKRVAAGGWEEEQWYAQVYYAEMCRETGDEGAYVHEMLKAYSMRPSRAESLYHLAYHFRNKPNLQPVAALFAGAGAEIPRTKDALFVSDYAYAVGCKEELAITGFYDPRTRARGADACSSLSLQTGPYVGARDNGRANLYWYLRPLKEFCPSFEWKHIPFAAPEGWVPLNPSVVNFRDRLWCVVRTVNYRINEHGQYLINGSDGAANATNPIHTRNWLLDIGTNPFPQKFMQYEITTPPLPVEFPLVTGFEDMRLFTKFKELWTSSTVRQLHPDGNCEQVLARIDFSDGLPVLTDVRRMLREPRETEKNWAPIPLPGETLFMWRPGVVVDTGGKTVSSHVPNITTDIVSGGSQLLMIDEGWLALVHTAHQIPGSPCRYYYHRWALYDDKFRLKRLSGPFVFHERTIEFAAGLAWQPADDKTLVISYGFQDKEARIATIQLNEVMRMLWAP